MDINAIIGITAGILTATSLVPQVIKTIREKKAEDVSLVMLFVLLGGLILWIIYGFRKSDLPVLITNLFSLLINVVMIFLGVRYKRNSG